MVRSCRESNKQVTCSLALSVWNGSGEPYQKGYFVVAMIGFSGGETAGWRCDQKIALLGDTILHHNTPYVGSNCMRTR